MKKLILVFALTSITSLWSGHGKLDLWHESTLSITQNAGIGTEFGYDLYTLPKDVVYGYAFMYYRVTDKVRLAIGTDYQGKPVTQVHIITKIGK